MKKLIVKIWKKVQEEVLDEDNDDNDYWIWGGRF
jgi:hypothetical protein